MTEAKLAPNLPDWMVEHTNRYLVQRRHRRAHLQDDPAGPAGDIRAVAIIDDDRPQVGRAVHLPAVLREDR